MLLRVRQTKLLCHELEFGVPHRVRGSQPLPPP